MMGSITKQFLLNFLFAKKSQSAAEEQTIPSNFFKLLCVISCVKFFMVKDSEDSLR